MYNLNFTRDLWMTLRGRIEERFRDGADGVAARLRLFAALRYRFWGPLVLALVDEAFFNLNSTRGMPPGAVDSGLDQNRLFFGPGIEGFKKMRLEVGYMAIFFERGEPDILQHTLTINLFMNF